jgi:hypothetical protein
MENWIKEFEKVFTELFSRPRPERQITLWTGVGGYELLDEAMDREFGYERIYVKKAPRIVKLSKTLTGKLYKRYGGNCIKRIGKEALSGDNGYVFSSYKSRV